VRASLTEATAWRLVRATPVGAGTVHVSHPDRPELRLEVDADGGWATPAFVTDTARWVLDLYLPLARSAAWVVGQMGQSLDGRIATESGHSHYVTGPQDIRRLHRLRSLADAVVVGAGTVAADDPRLTVREVEGEHPVRVVLDPEGRLSDDHRVFRDGAAPTLVFRAGAGAREAADADVEGRDAPGGVEELHLPPTAGVGLHPAHILEALRARGLHRILVEGGGVTVSRFLEAGVLDRLHVTVAPLILGSGRPAFTLEPVQTLSEALRPRCRTFPLGQDVLFELDLRRGPEEESEASG
jgi:riboflavin-specific deaminase-like protein